LIQINASIDLIGIVPIVMTFQHLYRARDYQPDLGDYGFALIRWMLNAIAISLIGAAIIIGLVIFSTIIHWGH
jgi:hypothetical protein